MSDTGAGGGEAGELSCTAKLARVVLENRGPLSAREVAREAHIGSDAAQRALAELAEDDLATPVCSVCDTREAVYALTERGRDSARPGEEPESH